MIFSIAKQRDRKRVNKEKNGRGETKAKINIIKKIKIFKSDGSYIARKPFQKALQHI